MKPKTSIFIPTKNAGEDFHKILQQISIQKEKNFELIIVDSGSTDNTLKIAEQFKEKFPIKIYEIKPEEFGHGKTRNLSIEYAKGEFIVFLTQDAIPYNDFWLSSLLENFKDSKVAGVFSKQVPRKNAREIEKFQLNYYFPNKKITISNNEKNLLNKMFFSNASSCVRKNVLIKYPFNEELIMTEDQEWAKRIIQRGYKKVYEPESIVIHSHNYNSKQTFQRYFDSAVSLNQILKIDFKKYVSSAKKYPIKELRYTFKKNVLLVPRVIFENIIKVTATKLGKNHQKLPLSLKKTFSMHKYYWINRNF